MCAQKYLRARVRNTKCAKPSFRLESSEQLEDDILSSLVSREDNARGSLTGECVEVRIGKC